MKSHALLTVVLPLALAPGCQQPGEPTDSPPVVEGGPLVGQPIGALGDLQWLDAEGADFGAHELTLLRWWTDSCGFCRSSVPDLSALHRVYAGRGLHFVAVYHPKPARAVTEEEVRQHAERLGVTGALAIDPRWSEVRRLMERGELRSATSISVLVDDRGVVRWTHAGPRLHRSRRGQHPEAGEDYAELEQFVIALLREE